MLRLVYNDDFEQPMTRARLGHAADDIAAWFDAILATPVDALVGCAVWTDICFHATRAGERMLSRPGHILPSAAYWHWQRIFEELEAAGTDILRLAAAGARRRRKRFLAGVRLSDAHHAFGAGYPADPRFPRFVHEHPEYRLRKPDFLRRPNDDEWDVTLDYSFPEVREHRLAIIRETIENYDLDGVELDFIRFGRHFPWPATADHTRIMTDLLRQIRQMLETSFRRRGRSDRPLIGARLPPILAACAPRGLDPAGWAREGLVDYLAPADFLFADFQLDIGDYLAAVRDTTCRVLFALQPWSAPQWSDELRLYALGFPLNVPEFRALAACGYAAGAHGLHAFNLSCEFPGRRAEMLAALEAVASPAAIRAGPRHYQYLPHDVATDALGLERRQTLRFLHDDMHVGACAGRARSPNAPRTARRAVPTDTSSCMTYDAKDNAGNARQPQSFRFRCGETREAQGRIVWRIYNSCAADRWQFRLNGQIIDPACVPAEYRPADQVGQTVLKFPTHMRFALDLRAAPRLRTANELEIVALALEPGYAGERVMELLEVKAG
jgi:hypothetical protein